jgi:hypothetical protein
VLGVGVLIAGGYPSVAGPHTPKAYANLGERYIGEDTGSITFS